jgi:hypothetical protein
MTQDNVVDKLLEELRQKASEIEEIYTTLQTLRKYGADIALPDLASLITGKEKPLLQSVDLEIQPGEFYNLSNTDAAEKYLRKAGHAIPLEDIYNALIEGGVRFSGDGRKNLNIQLTRATRKFAKIGRGKGVSFGLLEWYQKRSRLLKRTVPLDTEDEPSESQKEKETSIEDLLKGNSLQK